MSVVHVPIPIRDVEKYETFWLPFVVAIAERQKEYPEVLRKDVLDGKVQVHLAWDDDKKEALALCGSRILQQGDKRIGELLWTTGKGRHHWQSLLDDIERYLAEHQNCQVSKPVARPGWVPLLKSRGYRVTHVVMEKAIK